MTFPVGSSVYDITRKRFGTVINPTGAIAASSLPLLVQYNDPCGKVFTVNYTADGKLDPQHAEPVLRTSEDEITPIEQKFLWVLKNKSTGEYFTSLDFYTDEFVNLFMTVSTTFEFIEKIEHSVKTFRIGVR